MYARTDSKGLEPLELVVVLSTGCEEVLNVCNIKHEPCCNELFAACKEDQIVLVSPSILYGLLRRKRDGQDIISECLDTIAHHYVVYLNIDEDFVVLIPATKHGSLKELGFDETQLNRIEPEALMQFAAGRWASHLIEIDHFKKLFRVAESGYEPPAKHIYLISHGIDAMDEIKAFKWSMPLIASLTVWQFVNFLQMLNAINTKFLHIASCYAAGSNFFNVGRILSGAVEDERCINALIPIKFSIMVQGTTDSPVSAIIGDGQGCKHFFSVIRQWLEHDSDKDMLSRLLSESFYSCTNKACIPNYPLLKLSDPELFTCVPVQGVALVNQDSMIIQCSQDLHHLFFYPSVMHNTTLAIQTLAAVPHCISKTFGRSCHFLGTIQAPQLDEKNLVQLLEGCFLQEVIRNPDGVCGYGVSDKAWFIDSVISDNQNNPTVAKGVVVQKGMLKYGAHKALIAYQDAQGNFHRIKMALPIEHESLHNEIITENEYGQLAARIFWETKAGDEALSAATGGQQTSWHVTQGLHDFFSALNLSTPTIDARRFIQEDITQLRNRMIKKETYLNYVAHAHDLEILNELIELAIGHSDIINFKDITTLMTHFVDIEQQAICLNVTRQLLGKDDIAAKRAAINVLTYMEHVGLYQHASRACEDIFSCIDALACKQTLNSCEVDLIQEICNFFAQLMQTMVKEGQGPAADLIMSSMVNHEQWYMYGLGLEVCTQLMKQDMCIFLCLHKVGCNGLQSR